MSAQRDQPRQGLAPDPDVAASTLNDDIEVFQAPQGALDVTEEELNTYHAQPSPPGFPDLSAGPRDPASVVRDGGRGAHGRGAGEGDPAVSDQIAGRADEVAGQGGDLAMVAVAIRKSAERAPLVGGLRVTRLPDGIRITAGNADLLFRPPLLFRNGEEDFPVDVKKLIEAFVEALGFELLPEPLSSPSVPGLRIMAVHKALTAEFGAMVEAYQEGVAERARGPEDEELGGLSS